MLRKLRSIHVREWEFDHFPGLGLGGAIGLDSSGRTFGFVGQFLMFYFSIEWGWEEQDAA